MLLFHEGVYVWGHPSRYYPAGHVGARALFVCLFVCYLFVWAGWSFGSYSADVHLLYPPTHIHTEDSHNTGNFIPYSSRIVCGFFNDPQGTNEHGSYLWDRTSGLSSLSKNKPVQWLYEYGELKVWIWLLNSFTDGLSGCPMLLFCPKDRWKALAKKDPTCYTEWRQFTRKDCFTVLLVGILKAF